MGLPVTVEMMGTDMMKLFSVTRLPMVPVREYCLFSMACFTYPVPSVLAQMLTGKAGAGADRHVAVCIADIDPCLRHAGNQAEAHPKVPVVLKLASGGVRCGQICNRRGIGL